MSRFATGYPTLTALRQAPAVERARVLEELADVYRETGDELALVVLAAVLADGLLVVARRYPRRDPGDLLDDLRAAARRNARSLLNAVSQAAFTASRGVTRRTAYEELHGAEVAHLQGVEDGGRDPLERRRVAVALPVERDPGLAEAIARAQGQLVPRHRQVLAALMEGKQPRDLLADPVFELASDTAARKLVEKVRRRFRELLEAELGPEGEPIALELLGPKE